jgi:hypothetical protein
MLHIFTMHRILVLSVIGLPLISGCLLTRIIEEKTRVDPGPGDLSLIISLVDPTYDLRPERMVLTITLRNDCDHRVWVEDALSLGWTFYPNVTVANGNRVRLDYPLVDHEPRYTWFYPDDTKKETIDLSGMAHSIEIDGEDRDFDWDVPGSYRINVGWWGARTILEVRSNTLTFEIE